MWTNGEVQTNQQSTHLDVYDNMLKLLNMFLFIDGIVSNHAYSITKVVKTLTECGDEVKLLSIRELYQKAFCRLQMKCKLSFKADSHDLHLMCAAAADGCVSTEIGNFQFFRTTLFCRSCTRQIQLV